jgi:hypothetical protein
VKGDARDSGCAFEVDSGLYLSHKKHYLLSSFKADVQDESSMSKKISLRNIKFQFQKACPVHNQIPSIERANIFFSFKQKVATPSVAGRSAKTLHRFQSSEQQGLQNN